MAPTQQALRFAIHSSPSNSNAPFQPKKVISANHKDKKKQNLHNGRRENIVEIRVLSTKGDCPNAFECLKIINGQGGMNGTKFLRNAYLNPISTRLRGAMEDEFAVKLYQYGYFEVCEKRDCNSINQAVLQSPTRTGFQFPEMLVWAQQAVPNTRETRLQQAQVLAEIFRQYNDARFGPLIVRIKDETELTKEEDLPSLDKLMRNEDICNTLTTYIDSGIYSLAEETGTFGFYENYKDIAEHIWTKPFPWIARNQFGYPDEVDPEVASEENETDTKENNEEEDCSQAKDNSSENDEDSD